MAILLALAAGLLPAAAPAADPETLLAPLAGMPYRDDGVDAPDGRHTLFAAPTATFPTPGYNCSGFVVTASRALLRRPLPLTAVKRDRKGDSGPGSRQGEDWDFGYDLILNIGEGLPRRILAPGAPLPGPESIDAAKTRGFPLHDAAAWKEALSRLRPGEMAFAALSKDVKGRLLYYHVALVVRDPAGRVFFHHATPGTGVHRLEISAPAGMAALRKEFAEKRFGDKWVLLVAVPLP